MSAVLVLVAEFDGRGEPDVEAGIADLRRQLSRAKAKALPNRQRVVSRPSVGECWERRFFPCCEAAAYWVPLAGNFKPIKHKPPLCPNCDVVASRCATEQSCREFAKQLVESMQTPLLVELDRAGLAGQGVSFGLRELKAQLDGLSQAIHNHDLYMPSLDDDGRPPIANGGVEVRLSYEHGNYEAIIDAGEFSGLVEAYSLEHLLLALPLVSEEMSRIRVDQDGNWWGEADDPKPAGNVTARNLTTSEPVF